MRRGSIVSNADHVDRRSYEPVASPSHPIQKETLMRRHRLFIGLLIIIAAARFMILLASQTHVHSDEAIIGLMGKHILEGRYFPFYMYGQAYNAGAAWEAYLAAIAFAVFGVSVISLKSCIVVLSLLCLLLFYRMCLALYDKRTALLAAIVFALIPSLLKWHFQVRGYSWYFLSIPILTILFASIESASGPKRRTLFFFGLVCGLSIWCLELAIPLAVALWLLLILRGRVSLNNAASGLLGIVVGYAPAIAFNLTHHFSNWRYLIIERPGGFSSLFQLSTYGRIFLHEMPKFFGPDTVLWYYPDTPASGYVFYATAALAVIVAMWPFVQSPSKVIQALRGNLPDRRQKNDFDMLVLTVASLVPYLTMPAGVPSYFFGGCFFLSVLTGRMLERSLSCSKALPRLGGVAVLTAILLTAIVVIVMVGQKNQIETLSSCDEGRSYCMTRVPGTDIEGVEDYLRQHNVTSVWTTISFIYPLLFESRETLAVSDTIFEYPYRVYPEEIPWHEPSRGRDAAFVIESNSAFRPLLEMRCAQAFGAAPLVREYGKLTVIAEQR
jgi:4-amino-4-deoxy-L-arabinose transferase-like glycosyltransferase